LSYQAISPFGEAQMRRLYTESPSRITRLPVIVAFTSTASARIHATLGPSIDSAFASVSLVNPDRKVSGSTMRSLGAAPRTSRP